MMDSWIHVSPLEGTGDGEVQITVDANTSSEDRTTTVNVETSTLNKILTIIQKGKTDMNIDVLFFRKESNGDITAYLNNSERSAGEVQQILKTLITAPCLILYIKTGTVGASPDTMEYLFADSVTTTLTSGAGIIQFPNKISLTVSTTDITES